MEKAIYTANEVLSILKDYNCECAVMARNSEEIEKIKISCCFKNEISCSDFYVL